MKPAYYNELDPFAAQWLRNLIAAGHIAPGVGVWSHALRRAGWPDDRPVWTGSCPCQPFSSAGEGAGFDDERHLWPHFFHLISQRRPAAIFGEQVASRDANPWIDLVQDDLEGLGYGVGAVPFPSAGVGAPHIRDRLYWMAGTTNANGARLSRPIRGRAPEETPIASAWRAIERIHAARLWSSWLSESGTPALVDGAPARVGRLRAYGNAINAVQAQIFIEAGMSCMPWAPDIPVS